jgi:glucosamine kinase
MSAQGAADLFVGIDGGATKTLLRLEDAQGRILGEGRGGAANIRLSVEETWRSIESALDDALTHAAITLEGGKYRLHCGAGLAGTEVVSACDGFLAAPHAFATLMLRSDGCTACIGAHGGGDGAVIDVGTGTIGFQVESGRESRVGGWGFPHGDEGGGAWLGLKAVRATLQWLDGRGVADPLLEAVYAHFDRDLTRLVVWANAAKATEFGKLAPLVVAQAKLGTPLAIAFAKDTGNELDRMAKALAAKSTRVLPMCLLGGLGGFVEPWLEPSLRARLVPAKFDALQGALLMIRADFAAGEKR